VIHRRYSGLWQEGEGSGRKGRGGGDSLRTEKKISGLRSLPIER
jgi:hypothetical protein